MLNTCLLQEHRIEISGDQVNVLGICACSNKKNVKSFENLMNRMYGINLQY